MNVKAQEVMRKWREQEPLLCDSDYKDIWEYTVSKFSAPAYDHVPTEDRDWYIAILFDEEIGHWLFRRAVNATSVRTLMDKEVGAYV